MLFSVNYIKQDTGKESIQFIQKNSYNDLILYLEKKDIFALNIKQLPNIIDYLYTNISFTKVSDSDILFLFDALSGSMKAGISIINTLNDLTIEIKNSTFRNVLLDIIDHLEDGYTFVDACKKHPNIFKANIIQLLEIGQESGKFAHVLDDIVFTIKSNQELNKKIKQAMIYPTIGLITIFSVFLFWGIYVVPKIMHNLSGSKLELPDITLRLLDLFQLIEHHWLLITISFISLSILSILLIKNCKVCQQKLSLLLLKIPFVSTMIQEYNIILISKYLSLVLSTGKPLSFGINMLIKTISNISYKDELKNILNKIYNGEKLSESIKNSTFFTRYMYRNVLSGEYSGNLEDGLKNIDTFYSTKLHDKAKAITKFIEPLITVLLGILLLILIIGFLAPVYELILSI